MALRSSSNKVVSNHTLLTGSKHRILPGPGYNLARICLRGSPLAAEVEQGVAAGMVNQDAAPARPRIIINTNDNYCLLSPEPMAWPVSFVSDVQRQNFHVSVQQPVLCPVVSPVLFVLNVRGQSQKKDESPSFKMNTEINFVKSAFSVDHCVFAPSVPNAHNVVNAHLIGGRLQKFWQKWSLLGVNPRVVSILRDGYILPFKNRPPLVRDPLIVSGYANPLRNLYLKEALQALLQKEAVEMVRVRTSLAFFNRLFIVPKSNQKWRPILDLNAVNKFLSLKTFKMETPETIRIFLQQGEWVTSLDFSDAYFHIPVHVKSRKYLRFHFQIQFRALPFGLSTAPMEFTCVVKEVKLMAQSRGIRIHQYLDDWLIRAPTKESCHQGTQSLLALSGIGLGGEPTKIGVGTQTGFRIYGLPIRPLTRTGQTDPEPVGIDSPEGAVYHGQPNLSSQALHVTYRPTYGNRKTGAPGETPHETYPVAPQTTLEGPRISRKRDPSPKAPSSTPMVDQGDKYPTRPASAPFASCHSNLYRRLKRRLGCSLRRLHNKRYLVSSRKSPSYKLPGTKSGLASLKKIPALGARKSSSNCHRQHHSCGVHQQGGRYEIRLTLCASMATPVLVQSRVV